MISSRPDRVSARVLVRDADGHVLWMMRTRGDERYLTTIGGGVEGGESPADAARRECLEEAGAVIELGPELARESFERDGHTTLQIFFGAWLVSQDLDLRHGPELEDPSRGGYEPCWLRPDDPQLVLARPASAVRMASEWVTASRETCP